MAPLRFLPLLLLLLPLVVVAAADPSSNTTEFVRTSCTATLYPRICFKSLSPFAAIVQSNPALLAAVATNVTLDRIRTVSARIESVSTTSSVDSRTVAALKDCKEAFGNAIDLIEKSLEELKELLATGGADKAALHLGNAQTWMSAALTYEDTCTDGFEKFSGGPGGDVAAHVGARVKKVKELTSNALALVNKLAVH